MTETVLCRLADLADGAARGFDPAGEGRDSVFIVRRGERLHAWRNACPHVDGAPMAWRKNAYLNADGSQIVCAAHGALFDIATGVCTLGPAFGKALQPVALRIAMAQETGEAQVVMQLPPALPACTRQDNH